MDFFDVIRTRRSVRRYLPEPVPRDVTHHNRFGQGPP